ncbi:MAG: hypothetical protein Q8N74_09510 [Sulfuricella sp.]|nr:hypothetical protein [Sulfuricella sp.]
MEFPLHSGLKYSAIAAVLLLATAHAASAEQVVCHYTYGGETQLLAALPVKSPYAVTGIRVGSYFLFRLVFQDEPAESAAIKVYTYVDRDEVPTLIHQASFPYPPAANAATSYGFSGLHFVYEPVRDSELQYWCRMAPYKEAGR